MIKLLRADLTRMRKTKGFWVCVIISFVLSVLNSFIFVIDIRTAENTANNILYGTTNSLVLIAVFIALFLGTDYSQNTIRNKMIIGSNRTLIYLSNSVTVTIGAFAISLAEDIPAIAAAFFGKSFGMTANEFAFRMFIAVCAVIAMSAVLTLLGMLITAKSANTAISIVATFVLALGAAIILDFLNQPEYLSYAAFVTNDGEEIVDESDSTPNPMYIKPGVKRDILTAVNDVLPTGQVMQLETGSLHNKELMPLYSFGVLAVSTAVGVVVFRRKDLK